MHSKAGRTPASWWRIVRHWLMTIGARSDPALHSGWYQ